MVDVQRTLQAKPGLDRITTRREQSFTGFQLFAVQKTATLAGVAVFAFVGLRNVLASYNQNLGKTAAWFIGSGSSHLYSTHQQVAQA